MRERNRAKKNRAFGRRLSAVLFLVLLLAATLAVPARAAGGKVQFSLLVRQTFEDKRPADKRTDPNENIGTYRLTARKADNTTDTSAPMPAGATAGVYTFTLIDNDSKQLDILYDVAGSFRYKLEQISTSTDPDRKFDESVYDIEITTKAQDGDIVLESSKVTNREDGNKRYEVEFKNSYEYDFGDDGSIVTADPPVQKVIPGDKPEKEATFLFEMVADEKDKGWPMPDPATGEGVTYDKEKDPDKAQMTIVGEGLQEFGIMTYTEEMLNGASEKTFTYTVNEINTGEPGYTYDKKVYTVANRVYYNASGKLALEQTITWFDDETKTLQYSPVCLFTNPYKKPSPSDGPTPTPDPSVSPTPTPGGGSGTGTGRTGTSTGSGSSSGKSTGTTSVKTGDTNRPILWIGLLSGAALIFALAVLAAKRHKKGA